MAKTKPCEGKSSPAHEPLTFSFSPELLVLIQAAVAKYGPIYGPIVVAQLKSLVNEGIDVIAAKLNIPVSQ